MKEGQGTLVDSPTLTVANAEGLGPSRYHPKVMGVECVGMNASANMVIYIHAHILRHDLGQPTLFLTSDQTPCTGSRKGHSEEYFEEQSTVAV